MLYFSGQLLSFCRNSSSRMMINGLLTTIKEHYFSSIQMSLFKARDWWSTLCGSEEEFDKGCLCVANIDNNSDLSDKIVIGSHSGILRIYKPHPLKQENGSYTSFRPDELLLEVQLSSPIIRMCTGILVLSSNLLHLAVLHPFKISVYLVTVVQGTVEHGTYYHLSLVYEHNLQRHSFNMSVGPFGGIQDKDLICVQSLDGTLTFFEQESFAFSRFLPNFLLPGPLVYIKKTDSFITASAHAIENYRFQVLAVAKDSEAGEEISNFKGKRVMSDWAYNLGEAVLDIVCVECKQTSSTILILGEKSLFAINSNGTLKFSKKMDYIPSCFLAYAEGTEGSIVTVVVTFSQTLLVYQDTQLRWAAQLAFCPVAIHRITLVELKGILVALCGNGNLSCCYMGTNPSLFVSPLTEAREINFEEAEKEMHKLKKIIKSSSSYVPGTHKLGNEITIVLSISQYSDTTIGDGSMIEQNQLHKDLGPVPSVSVKVQLKCTSVAHDVRLMIHVEPPLEVCQNVFNFGSVMDFSQAIVNVFLGSPYLVSSLKFSALTTYTNCNGAPRVTENFMQLPFNLVAKTCPPSKNSKHRITIDINKKNLSVSELFSDLSPDTAHVSGGALGIEYYGGQQVTILTSKTSARYRIQSDDFSSMWLVIFELLQRLHHKFRKEDENSKLQCLYSSTLPLQDFFKVIEDHFENRRGMEQIEDLLGHRAEQFRVVQKRLLTKLKDKTPTPLNNLDTLLEATHRHILSLGETIEKNTTTLKSSCCALSCATHLILALLKLSSGLKDDEYSFVTACFSPHVDLDSRQGWEERIYVALTYMLRFCLGKTSSELNIPDISLEMPKDLSKLKKYFSLVIEKLMSSSGIDINASNENEQIMVNEENETEFFQDDDIIPVGSKFGENKREDNDSSVIAQTPSDVQPLSKDLSGGLEVIDNFSTDYQGNYDENEMII